jgi:hypothetical protein
MPFHDVRSTAGFRTPVQPKLGFVRAKYFANHSHSASFPRFYLLDQLFQSRRMKNPQPLVKYHSKMPPDSHLGAPQSGCGYGHRSEADDKPDGKPQPGIARQAEKKIRRSCAERRSRFSARLAGLEPAAGFGDQQLTTRLGEPLCCVRQKESSAAISETWCLALWN